MQPHFCCALTVQKSELVFDCTVALRAAVQKILLQNVFAASPTSRRTSRGLGCLRARACHSFNSLSESKSKAKQSNGCYQGIFACSRLTVSFFNVLLLVPPSSRPSLFVSLQDNKADNKVDNKFAAKGGKDNYGIASKLVAYARANKGNNVAFTDDECAALISKVSKRLLTLVDVA